MLNHSSCGSFLCWSLHVEIKLVVQSKNARSLYGYRDVRPATLGVETAFSKL